jgi:starch synthase
VSAALPAALRALGIDTHTLLPAYPVLLEQLDGTQEMARLQVLGQDLRLLQAGEFLLLDCPALYARAGGPYQDAAGADWPDNGLRFGVLSRVAALLGTERSPLAWRPDVVHCNDWPAGLCPVYLGFEPGRKAASLLTVHNLSFQGNFDASLVSRLGLPQESFTWRGAEFHGQLSFLKGGLAYADALTTVSPTYAREIQTDEYGCGLDGLVRERSTALTGILNGIDEGTWDPARDERIAARYDASSLEAKRANKAALQKRLGLQVDSRIPLLGVVSRFTHQKGTDLLAAAAADLAATPAQLALVGKGERGLEEALLAVAARHPGRIAVVVGFDEDLAHAVEAGADLFLMPSRFEPCGLNQMYSQRYGTPPVVRATGGLADTVAEGATGFLFERAESGALVDAVKRAVGVWRDPARWREIQRTGMRRDFSWSAAARRYASLYSRIATPG